MPHNLLNIPPHLLQQSGRHDVLNLSQHHLLMIALVLHPHQTGLEVMQALEFIVPVVR
jgi:hypothetical protein